jgi:hypothetical protein
MSLAISVFRANHAHFLASRPDITDTQIQQQIDLIAGTGNDDGEFDFSDLSFPRQQAYIGYAVCHRLQIMMPVAGCNPHAHLAGRAMMVATETDKVQTNAVAMKNPSAWTSTICGGLFQEFVDGGGGIASFGGCGCR